MAISITKLPNNEYKFFDGATEIGEAYVRFPNSASIHPQGDSIIKGLSFGKVKLDQAIGLLELNDIVLPDKRAVGMFCHISAMYTIHQFLHYSQSEQNAQHRTKADYAYATYKDKFPTYAQLLFETYTEVARFESEISSGDQTYSCLDSIRNLAKKLKDAEPTIKAEVEGKLDYNLLRDHFVQPIQLAETIEGIIPNLEAAREIFAGRHEELVKATFVRSK